MSKVKFPCGHRGKGKFCHRCANEAKPEKDPAGAKEYYDDRPIICQDCGNEVSYCICPGNVIGPFPDVTVGEFRNALEDSANRMIDRIKKQLKE